MHLFRRERFREEILAAGAAGRLGGLQSGHDFRPWAKNKSGDAEKTQRFDGPTSIRFDAHSINVHLRAIKDPWLHCVSGIDNNAAVKVLRRTTDSKLLRRIWPGSQ